MSHPFTHRGWLLLCPIYAGDVDSDEPVIEERRFIPFWWFEANVSLANALNWVIAQFDPEHESVFPIMYTGRLNR